MQIFTEFTRVCVSLCVRNVHIDQTYLDLCKSGPNFSESIYTKHIKYSYNEIQTKEISARAKKMFICIHCLRLKVFCFFSFISLIFMLDLKVMPNGGHLLKPVLCKYATRFGVHCVNRILNATNNSTTIE